MNRLFALILLSISGAALSAENLDCKNAVTTLEMNECAAQDQQKVEARLNVVYQKLLERLGQPDVEDEVYSVRQQIVKAQRAWVAFRQADCEAQYEMHKTGTIRTLIYIGCMQARAEQRIKELENYAPY